MRGASPCQIPGCAFRGRLLLENASRSRHRIRAVVSAHRPLQKARLLPNTNPASQLLQRREVAAGSKEGLPRQCPTAPPLITYYRRQSPQGRGCLLANRTRHIDKLYAINVSALLAVDKIRRRKVGVEHVLDLVLDGVDHLGIEVTRAIGELLHTAAELGRAARKRGRARGQEVHAGGKAHRKHRC